MLYKYILTFTLTLSVPADSIGMTT